MSSIRTGLAAAVLLLLALAVGGATGLAQGYPPPVGSLSTETSDTNPVIGGTTTVTASVLSAAGVPEVGVEVLFQIESQPGNDATFANGLTQITAITDENGVATAVLSVGATPGEIVVKTISGEKASQVTLQVQAVGEAPETGGPPTGEGSDGLAAWQAAAVALSVAVLLGGTVVLVRRRRA